MPTTLQNFFADAAQEAATDLETAFLRLPEDKRNWVPDEKSRSAIDQVAECAMLNGYTVGMLTTRVWPPNYDFQEYLREKAELAKDWSAVKALLDENTMKVAAAIHEVPDGDLDIQIQMPWGPMALSKIIAYPYWNMTYHQGQINYIASMLGCLE